MADIFHEVDEEVRRDQFKRLWERYGNLAIGAAIVFVAAIGAWRAYQWYEAREAAAAGARFEAAMLLSEQGKGEDAQAAFARVATDGAAGYRALARLREAAELAQRDPKAAVEGYDRLANDASLGPALRELATLRAGTLLVDTGAYADVRSRLEPISGPDHTFRHSAREMLMLAAWRAGDVTAMRQWYDMAAADPETPAPTRSRMDILNALAAGQGKS